MCVAGEDSRMRRAMVRPIWWKSVDSVAIPPQRTSLRQVSLYDIMPISEPISRCWASAFLMMETRSLSLGVIYKFPMMSFSS